LAVGTRVDVAKARFSFVPISRFVRWQVVFSGTGTFDATFMIHAAVI
jgi:hypothetical protein